MVPGQDPREAPWDVPAHPAICFQFRDTGGRSSSSLGGHAAGSACLKDYTLSELCRAAESTGGRTTRSIVPHPPSQRPDWQEMSPRDRWKENTPRPRLPIRLLSHHHGAVSAGAGGLGSLLSPDKVVSSLSSPGINFKMGGQTRGPFTQTSQVRPNCK